MQEVSVGRCPSGCHERGSCLEDPQTRHFFCHCNAGFTGNSCQHVVPASSLNDPVIALSMKSLLLLLGVVLLCVIIGFVGLRIWKRWRARNSLTQRPSQASNFDPPLIVVNEPRTPETKRKGGSPKPLPAL